MTSVSPDIRLGHSFGNDEDPPSPSAVSRPIDIPGSYAHAWESNDYGASPANFGAYTPSYVGSFGSQQESAWGDREATAASYSVGASGDLFDDSKYEPEGYGAGGSPYLMMEDQSGFATLSGGRQQVGNNDSLFPTQDIHPAFHDVDPRQFSPRPGEVFNTGSPGSSIGIGEQGPRSRASSMSSNPGAQSSPFMSPNDFPGQHMNDQFTKLSFHQSLDAWRQQNMTSPPQDLSSPSQKPLSPPTLFIPAEVPPPNLPIQTEEHQPAINLVPATPVSGGGAGSHSQLPFQQMLANLNRQRAQGAAFGRGNVNAATAQALPPVTSFATSLGESSAHTNSDAMTWRSIISASGQSQGTAPSALPQSRVYHHGYNVPLPEFGNPSTQQSPSLAMQLTNTNTLPHLPHQSLSDSSIPSTSGIHLPPFSSPQSHNLASFSETSLLTAPSLTRNRSKSDTSTRPPQWLDPASSTSASLSSMSNDLNAASSSFNFTLTPSLQRQTNNMGSIFGSNDLTDLTLGLGEPTTIRRSNSDGGRHRRSVKSEDLSSLRTPRLVPTSSTDFIRSVTAADGSLAPVDPRSPPLGGPGPTRRRGSGSGHERNSSLSSLRATPYQRPSPHTSPGGSPHHSPEGGDQPLPGDPQAYMRVERPLVTTPATKTASANRRRAEASFTCPVPGCGSTFTRHFNLRGHLRSHNEERPFKCKWPGCEKGFARQHDCKRHEALHLNIRPYTCEGCQKTFARMDALNRHLRSEGGVDCQKHHQAAEGSPNSVTNDLGQSSVPPTTGMPKIEQESSPWTQSGALVM